MNHDKVSKEMSIKIKDGEMLFSILSCSTCLDHLGCMWIYPRQWVGKEGMMSILLAFEPQDPDWVYGNVLWNLVPWNTAQVLCILDHFRYLKIKAKMVPLHHSKLFYNLEKNHYCVFCQMTKPENSQSCFSLISILYVYWKKIDYGDEQKEEKFKFIPDSMPKDK